MDASTTTNPYESAKDNINKTPEIILEEEGQKPRLTVKDETDNLIIEGASNTGTVATLASQNGTESLNAPLVIQKTDNLAQGSVRGGSDPNTKAAIAAQEDFNKKVTSIS